MIYVRLTVEAVLNGYVVARGDDVEVNMLEVLIDYGCVQERKNEKFCHDDRNNVKCVECHTEGPGVLCCEDRQWTEWGDWSECSQTCGHEVSVRTRTCQESLCPEAADCVGASEEREECCHECCPSESFSNPASCSSDHVSQINTKSWTNTTTTNPACSPADLTIVSANKRAITSQPST
jgi:hypothetical protein